MSTTTSKQASTPDWPAGPTYDDRRLIDSVYCRDAKHLGGTRQHQAAWNVMHRLDRVLPALLTDLTEQAEQASQAASRAAGDPDVALAKVLELTEQASRATSHAEAIALVIDQARGSVPEAMTALLAGIEDRAIERGQWAKEYVDRDMAAIKESRSRPALPCALHLLEAEAKVITALEDERTMLLNSIPFDSAMAQRNQARAEQIADMLGIEVEDEDADDSLTEQGADA